CRAPVPHRRATWNPPGTPPIFPPRSENGRTPCPRASPLRSSRRRRATGRNKRSELWSSCRSVITVDEPATEHIVTIVEDGALPRCDACHWCMELHFHPVLVHQDGARGALVLVADLGHGLHGPFQRGHFLEVRPAHPHVLL